MKTNEERQAISMERNFNTQKSTEIAALKQARTSNIHQIANILAAGSGTLTFNKAVWIGVYIYIHLISKKHA